MTEKKIEIHEYYFAEHTGNLKGCKAYTRDIITISGPFVKFNNNILYTKNEQYYLPTDKIEGSPFLKERTIKKLRELSKQ